MNIAVNNPQDALGTISKIKTTLITEFQRTQSEDQFMNEMIEVR